MKPIINEAETYGFETGDVDSNKVYPGGDGGDWGGSMPRALEIGSFARDCTGKKNPFSSQKRSRIKTASGNVSDHYKGNLKAYAIDIPASGEEGDELLACIMKKFNNGSHSNYKGGSWLNVNLGGYRYQFGWKVKGHFDHIHVGVKKGGGGKEETVSEPQRKVESNTLMKGTSFKIIAKPTDHSKRPLGNWQSDNAWDIQAPVGTRVYSLTKGKVSKVYESKAGNTKVYGTQVSIEGTDGFPDIFYTHLKNVKLTKNQDIYPGDLIGEITRWDANPESSHVHIGIKGNNMALYSFMDDSGKLKNVSKDSEGGFDFTGLSPDKIDSILGPGVKGKGTSFIDIFTSLGNLLAPDKKIKEDIDRMKDIMKKIL